MSVMRAPGVYFEPSEQRVPPLELGQTGVPVFIGITRRGPLDRPMLLSSEARFVEVFGESVGYSYLASALKGFFDNGGERCFVLRVARVEGAPGEDLARPAQAVVFDQTGAPTLEIRAQDPGTWGNALKLALTPSAPVRTFLTRDADAGEDRIQVKSTHGLTPGTVVQVHTPEGAQWSTIRKVDGKTVVLDDVLTAAFASSRPTYVSAHTFDLRIWDFDHVERFEGLSLFGRSPRYVERIINEQSRLIRVEGLKPDTAAVQCMPVLVEQAGLLGGSDGLEHLGPADFIGYDRGPGDRRGLASLIEHPDIDLICMPDLMAAWEQSRDHADGQGRFRSLRDVEIVQDAVISFCERSQNCFAILDMPRDVGYQHALEWRQQYDTAHAALYFPWFVVLDPARRTVPPCGHIAGIYARSDHRDGVHKAPANEMIQGIVDLDVLLQDAHLAQLNERGINCMRAFGPRGLRVWGARTLSSDPEWRYINVRRTISAISNAIERGTQWAVFEPNGQGLWKRISRIVVSFLSQLREQGMLVGETPEDAFFVQCDAETNPPDDVDRGMLTTQIGLAVTRPVEFIVFRLSQRLEDQARSDEE
jgi:hypothetical protein